MKEDKENTRPREKKVEIKCEEKEKLERPNKEKKEAMTKIVIRRLPPSLTKDELEEQLQPLPEVDYFEFFSSDTSLSPHRFARAYLNFKHQEDIVLFRDRFDGYVFIDNRGQEYPAIVEFAPFQKVAKKKNKKKDAKSGTIEEDSDYKRFLEIYNGDDEKFSSTPETLLEEIEAKTKELFAKKTTPLLDFLKNKQRLREEKREERRRRELERKRLRDEERRKWKEEDRRKRKEAEKFKKEKAVEKDNNQPKEEQPKIKLLKKTEKPENGDTEKPKEKPKRPDREKPKEDRAPGGVDGKKHQSSEHREDKTRKLEEDGCREHRERDVDRERDRDRERERRQKEKDRIRRQDEDRRKRRERHDGENTYKKRDEERRREKEYVWEKRKSENTGDSSQADKSEKSSKDVKKEENVKKDRLRNKDRPAIQLYQPGARSRNRGAGGGDGQPGDKKAERDAKNTQDKGEE